MNAPLFEAEAHCRQRDTKIRSDELNSLPSQWDLSDPAFAKSDRSQECSGHSSQVGKGGHQDHPEEIIIHHIVETICLA